MRVYQAEVDNVTYEGLPSMAILTRLLEGVIVRGDIPDVKKAVVAERVAKADRMIADGANESLQLLDVAALMMRELGSFGPPPQAEGTAMVVG